MLNKKSVLNGNINFFHSFEWCQTMSARLFAVCVIITNTTTCTSKLNKGLCHNDLTKLQ